MMDWLDEKAVDLAAQAATQLLTLAVAILALIAAWKVATEGRRWQRYILKASVVAYLVSLVAGIWFLLALTGSVASEETPGVTYGVVQYQPRQLQTDRGTVTFQPNSVPVRIEHPAEPNADQTVRLVPLEKPTIWAFGTRLPMLLQAATFCVGSLFVVTVFVTWKGRKPGDETFLK
jgi:hypothetical protein